VHIFLHGFEVLADGQQFDDVFFVDDAVGVAVVYFESNPLRRFEGHVDDAFDGDLALLETGEFAEGDLEGEFAVDLGVVVLGLFGLVSYLLESPAVGLLG
jgi:hypothetical protein